MSNEVPTDSDYEDVHRGPRERRHRLPRETYRGFKCVAFTVCASDGSIALADADVFRALREWLETACAKHGADLVVLTVMPDHFHATLQGLREDADLWAAMCLFKQKCGFLGPRLLAGLRLQKGFYDHIIRKDEDLRNHVRYILSNPVRAGPVDTCDQYPFSFTPEGILL